MERIELRDALPRVFSGNVQLPQSDLWLTHVELTRGNYYLVEANSGTGKSSLLSYIVGHRHDYLGDILFDGHSARSLGIRQWVELRRRHLSLLFQELRLFPELTAMENVEIKNQLTRRKAQGQIMQWFEALGIADKANTRVGLMSFGQQQRVALVRALVQPFDFLLLDEPVSHLDTANAEALATITREEAEAQGAAVVVTSIGRRLPLSYDKTFRL